MDDAITAAAVQLCHHIWNYTVLSQFCIS